MTPAEYLEKCRRLSTQRKAQSHEPCPPIGSAPSTKESGGNQRDLTNVFIYVN
jgi:hypothetical protein